MVPQIAISSKFGAAKIPKAAVPILSDLADVPAGNPVISFCSSFSTDPQEPTVLMAYFRKRRLDK